ncbi:MAG: MFS transporter [Alphaproteobacteria bacterium]|nr:MFS transporter [Alphaproteobacteria bacterium]
MARQVDVAEIVANQKFGPFQFRIVLLCGMVQFIDGFDTQALAYAAPALREAWNLSPRDLGPVFALGALGTGLGSLVLGFLADIFGRKKVMIAAVAIFGILTLGTAFLTGIDQLRIWRLLTGFGLGAALPLTFVIANEFAPSRIRGRMLASMACGFAVGALTGGLLEAALLPYLGWQAIFYVGGVVPLILAVALIVFLPESVRFLAAKGGRDREVARILRKADPALVFPDDTQFVVPAEKKRGGFRPVQLFGEGRALTTILLWFTFLMTLGMLNTLNNWLPVAINMAGLPIQRAVVMTTLFQLGGIAGVLSLGVLADRFGYYRVLVIAYVALAVAIAAIGSVGSVAIAIAASVALTGLFLVGANNTLNAFATTLYPTSIRSTGVSWASSFGRLGGAMGPYFGGLLLGAIPLQPTFFIFAVPALLAALLVLGMLKVRNAPPPVAAEARA